MQPTVTSLGSKGASIKYVTQYLTNFDPFLLSHFVTHLGNPQSTSHISDPLPIFSSTCIHTYVLTGVCLSSRRFLTGGFCSGFLSGRFCPGWFLYGPLFLQNTFITTERYM